MLLKYLSFATRDHSFAIELNAVAEVALLPKIQTVPSSLTSLEGVVLFRGEIIPVFCLATLIGLQTPAMHPYQHLVVIKSVTRVFALRVEHVLDLVELEQMEIVNPMVISPLMQRMSGLAEGPSGIVFIQDPEAFLSAAEQVQLDEALQSLEVLGRAQESP